MTMMPPPEQLAALLAIVEEGTFEAAGRALHVTTSAISQRIRALETSCGQVVVRRSTPCEPTEAGEVLVRLARQTALLYAEAGAVLAADEERRASLAVVVNADSLATWFRGVMAEIATWTTSLHLFVEDQAHSTDLLRRGDVLAAVTSDPTPVQGCSVEALGVLRYRPAAAPEFAARWRHGRGPRWADMPVVAFNEKDTLQRDYLAARGVAVPAVRHRVPTSADFHEAVRLGLGWALVPEPQLLPDLEAGRLEVLHARDHVDVALYWQRWRLASPTLDRLSAAVRSAASSLRAPK
ncbi:LysR family transcriptional regulator ArgP [Nocardioides sp. R-C-SC26]|uniref:LysR family transcriptional regulator ArgP n=1 Tax=Nocardioides sp. R-C-SC26 TaxID=2870414 RepID=UPI001E4AED60|nr:LysR family transcriptional regulator ArgP [Nocardioides sp. R-C-SC26]